MLLFLVRTTIAAFFYVIIVLFHGISGGESFMRDDSPFFSMLLLLGMMRMMPGAKMQEGPGLSTGGTVIGDNYDLLADIFSALSSLDLPFYCLARVSIAALHTITISLVVLVARLILPTMWRVCGYGNAYVSAGGSLRDRAS